MHISYTYPNNQVLSKKSLEKIYFTDNCVTIFDSDSINKKEISHTENTICILYGEVYNGKDVILSNHYPWDRSLSESIIRPISDKNFSLLSQLNGSFCFVIYSKKDQRLQIISDRYGSQRYYFGHIAGKWVFSSTIWQFKKYGFSLNLDKEYLLQFLSFGYIQTNHTHLNDVKLNGNASIVIVNKNIIEHHCYWKLEFNEQNPITDIKQMVNSASQAWPKAVEKRLSVNSDFIIPLSGGLDSRAVLAAALECKPAKDIVTFTGGTPGTFDFEIGKLIAKKTGVTNITLDLTKIPKDYYDEYYQSMHDLDGLVDIIPHFYGKDWLQLTRYSSNMMGGFLVGAFVGAHLSEKMIGSVYYRDFSNNEFIENILSFNLTQNLNNPSSLLGIHETACKEVLGNIINETNVASTNKWLPNQIAQWDFINRQRKYTLTLLSPRSYYNFLIPYLDNEWVELCLQASPTLRYNFLWYRKFLKKKYPDLYSLPTKNLYGRPLKQSFTQKVESCSEESLIYLLSRFPSKLGAKASAKVRRLYQSKFFKPYAPDPQVCRQENLSINYMDYNYWLRGANKQWAEVVYALIDKTIAFDLVLEKPVHSLIEKQLAGDDQSGIILLYLASLGLLLDVYQTI
jgi:asparagine synthase (glutamine-hydrolysing)